MSEYKSIGFGGELATGMIVSEFNVLNQHRPSGAIGQRALPRKWEVQVRILLGTAFFSTGAVFVIFVWGCSVIV